MHAISNRRILRDTAFAVVSVRAFAVALRLMQTLDKLKRGGEWNEVNDIGKNISEISDAVHETAEGMLNVGAKTRVTRLQLRYWNF